MCACVRGRLRSRVCKFGLVGLFVCEYGCCGVGFCLDVVSEVSCELVVDGVAVFGVFSSLGDERDLDGILGRLCWVKKVRMCEC